MIARWDFSIKYRNWLHFMEAAMKPTSFFMFYFFWVIVSSNVYGWTINKNKRFLKAVIKNNYESVTSKIEDGINLNYQDKVSKDTALILAARNNHLKLFKLLFVNDADINLCNALKQTPLMVAAESGSLSIVSYIVEKVDKSYLNKISFKARNALHYAIGDELTSDKKKIASILIAAGIDCTAMDLNEMPPMFYAIKHNNSSLVQEMIEHGYNINHQIPASYLVRYKVWDPNIWQYKIVQKKRFTQSLNALMKACLTDSSPLIINLLLATKRLDLNIQDRNGYTALMYAAKTGQLEKLKILLEYNCNYDLKTFAGKTALDISIVEAQTEVQIYLKKMAKKATKLKRKKRKQLSRQSISPTRAATKTPPISPASNEKKAENQKEDGPNMEGQDVDPQAKVEDESRIYHSRYYF